MAFMKRAEAYWQELLEKWAAKQKMALVVMAVKELRKQCSGREGPFVTLAVKHVDLAETALDAAARHFGEDDISDANNLADRALMHVRVAIHHLSSFKEEKFDPGFQDGGPRHTVAALASSLARTKMAVEYNNSIVDEPIRKGLIGVAKMLDDAVELIGKGDGSEAKRTAEGALLWLYELAQAIELENRQPIVDGRALYKTTSKEVKRIRELCDSIVSARRMFMAAEEMPDKIARSIDEAQECYQNAIGAYMDQDHAQVDNLTHAGRILVEKATNQFENLLKAESANEVQKAKDKNLVKDAALFRKRLGILLRLLEGGSNKSDMIAPRLNAALKFFNEAQDAYEHGNWEECQRLARACHLDIDFARQLFEGKGKANYADL
jgi:hypothetical protein